MDTSALDSSFKREMQLLDFSSSVNLKQLNCLNLKLYLLQSKSTKCFALTYANKLDINWEY